MFATSSINNESDTMFTSDLDIIVSYYVANMLTSDSTNNVTSHSANKFTIDFSTIDSGQHVH